MNLQPLKWTKQVRPSGEAFWAYQAFGVGHGFSLAWQDQAEHASQPAQDDLLLLRQHDYVTHLVSVLDAKPSPATGSGDAHRSSLVAVLWVIDWTSPQSYCKATQVLGFPEVMYWQGDDAMYLPALPSFQRRWPGRSGLQDWQAHVRTQLQLT